MEVIHHFDSGVTQPYELGDGEVTFDLRPGQRILNVVVRDALPQLRVHLMADDKGEVFLTKQGLLYATDGRAFRVAPFERTGEERLSTDIDTRGGRVHIATRYPYGRDALDRLIVQCANEPQVSVRLLEESGRTVPVFDLIPRGTRGLDHYIIAGEDVWETAGCWTADWMVRLLLTDPELAARVLNSGAIHIVPLASPYSATLPSASYTTPEGKGIYGAATWGDEEPPPEYALLRDEVEACIKAGALGLMLTMHSWQGSRAFSEMGTIRESGENRLDDSRAAWAESTMEGLTRDVPLGRFRMSEKIWHPGLARDRLLGVHDAVTFRIEITTVGQGTSELEATARGLLEGLGAVESWEKVLPCQSNAG